MEGSDDQSQASKGGTQALPSWAHECVFLRASPDLQAPGGQASRPKFGDAVGQEQCGWICLPTLFIEAERRNSYANQYYPSAYLTKINTPKTAR